MNLEIEQTRSLGAPLQARLDGMLQKLQADHYTRTWSVPKIAYLTDSEGREAVKISAFGSAPFDALKNGLQSLGFWTDRSHTENDSEIWFRSPRSGGGSVMPSMGEGIFDSTNDIFSGLATAADKHSRLKFSGFADGNNAAGTAELHQRIISTIERSVKIYSNSGIMELEGLIGSLLDNAVPDSGANEVEVIHEAHTTLYRVTVKHNQGRCDAFFVTTEPTSTAGAA